MGAHSGLTAVGAVHVVNMGTSALGYIGPVRRLDL